MKAGPTARQQSASEEVLMVDIKLVPEVDTPPKFLFGKQGDTSFGFKVKKFFLGPLMRNEAKRHMLNILSQAVFNTSLEANKLMSHIRNLKWGEGVNSGMVTNVIAKTILHGHRDIKTKPAFQWTRFINGASQDEIVEAYLDNPVNLKTEILENFKNRLDILPGLNKLIYCATHVNHEVSMADMIQMQDLMSAIAELKTSSTMKIPFELERKIREVFQNVAKRFDVDPD